MMNFYEEFGVPNDASVEQIRQAYKTLARVLHPDSQTDEKLRAAAACQMKRLHEVLDIFVDPGKRRAYDESLAAAAVSHLTGEPFVAPPGKPEWAHFALRYWSWILMGCMILGSGFWYMTARVPTATESAASGFSATALPNGTAAPMIEPLERAAKHAVGASGTGTRLSRATQGALPGKSSGANPEPPVLPDVLLPVPVALPSLTPTAASARLPEVRESVNTPSALVVRGFSFAGEWFYVPAIEKPDPYLYAPEDINLQLTEKDGILTGQYRGRYKVPDASVSQDVVFQVHGKSSAEASVALMWTSSDGASGEIDLNLRQPNLMRVTWWTTHLGRGAGLSSGESTLFRQQAR